MKRRVTTTESGMRRLEDLGESPVTLALPNGQRAPRRIDTETLAMNHSSSNVRMVW